MIRIVKITEMTYPYTGPETSTEDPKGSMGLRFAKGQKMVTPVWADIFEIPNAGPWIVHLDVERSEPYVIDSSLSNKRASIRNLSIWTDDAGLISASGDAYIDGNFWKRVRGPIAYVIGVAGTVFIPAKKVAENDVI
jgi:hypothetical protein